MAIKVEMLRCFHAVVDNGNLMQAAKELGRKSLLTALGEMIHVEARRELIHFDKSVLMINALARSQAGLVRTAATSSAANTILPPVIEGFAASHPAVRIDLRDLNFLATGLALFAATIIRLQKIGINSLGRMSPRIDSSQMDLVRWSKTLNLHRFLRDR